MKRKTRSGSHPFAHGWVAVAYLTVFWLMTGCSSELSGGAGGNGGAPSETAGMGGNAVVVDELDAVPDTRWNAPDGLEQVIAAPSNAVACTLGSQCPTGNCVDGYCCDSKCDNKCMACSAAKKGGGVDGICGSVAYDTDPDNDCPYGACDGKNVCKNYNGFGCTSTAECLSNYCVDGICCGNICMGACQACSAAKKGGGTNGVCGNIAAGTNPDNECASGGTCNGSGACSTSITKQANGGACATSAQCTSGFCADGVCCDSWCLGTCQACSAAKKFGGVDGVCGPIANDKDPDEECWGGACNGVGVCKQYNGVPCNDKSQCLSGYCVDGMCCGNICTGMCYACSEAKKGQGYDGVCGPMASGKDPENECNPGECNGSGTCNQPQTPQANGTTCVSGGQCASSNCIDGYCCDTACTGTCQACSAAKKGSGANGTCGNITAETDPDAECGIGSRCGGNGTCRFYNGATCSAGSQCFSNYCVDGVCCGNVCTSTCYACTAAKKGQGSDGACGPIANTKDPDNECNPGECNGSGACNQSQVLLANGAACATSAQCTSGFCTDGVCCDTACSGLCQACTATKKGSGSNGTCGNIKYDADPDNECYAGSCSGTGTCQYYNGVACATTAECLSNYCVDGFCCGNVCSGTCYACSAAKKGSGSNGSCGLIAANTDPDNECGLDCNGAGACAKGPNGTACSAAADCNSGFCVDGVCCNSACTGNCEACSAAKNGWSDGTCDAIAANTDPDDECSTGDCDGSGACTGVLNDGTTCTMDNQCYSGHCVDGVCCNGACNGTCLSCIGAKTDRYDGYCWLIKDGTDPDGECGAFTCNGQAGCYHPNGDPCTHDINCASNFCRDGYCCDTSCSDTCVACSAAQKGSGANGTCGAIPAGSDPIDECVGTVCGVGPVCAAIPCSTGSDCPTQICSAGYCLGNVIEVVTNEHTSCALFIDSSVKCWGYGSSGLDPSTMGANLPKLDFGVGKVARQIAIGYTFLCARLSNDSVVCWGDNDHGQLGSDTWGNVGVGGNLVPVNLGTGKVAIQIAMGDKHACALLNDHSVKCWGQNESGELGLGDNLDRGKGWSDMGDDLPAVDLGTGRTAIAVAAGISTSCAILDNNTVKCWGNNTYGQLGLGDTAARGDGPSEMGNNLPAVDLGTGKTAVEISMNGVHVCARLNDASVKCWGYNIFGAQLGLGDKNNRGDNPGEMGNNLPAVNLGTGKTATRISVGFGHSCAILNDGNVKCWGANYSGELGQGLPTTTMVGDAPGEMGDNLPPVNLGTGKTVVNIDAGNANNCVILNDGNVKCWGNNYNGQLGIGMPGNRGELTSDMGDNLPALILQ